MRNISFRPLQGLPIMNIPFNATFSKSDHEFPSPTGVTYYESELMDNVATITTSVCFRPLQGLPIMNCKRSYAGTTCE